MNNSNTEIIKKALLQVELTEIHYLESFSSVSFEPSENHKNTVNKIIKSERKRENSVLKLSAKKRLALLIASIIIFALIMTSCIFGNQIKELIIDIYESMMGLSSYDDNLPDYKEYTFNFIPAEYNLVEYSSQEDVTIHRYSNGQHRLNITQNSSAHSKIQIDNKNSTYHTVVVNGITVHCVLKHNTYSIVWKMEGTNFTLTCHDSIEWSDIEKIIVNTVLK